MLETVIKFWKKIDPISFITKLVQRYKYHFLLRFICYHYKALSSEQLIYLTIYYFLEYQQSIFWNINSQFSGILTAKVYFNRFEEYKCTFLANAYLALFTLNVNNQSINWLIIQSINWLINQSIYWSINQSMHYLLYQITWI